MAQRELFKGTNGNDPTKNDEGSRPKPRIRQISWDQLGLEVVDLETLLPDEHRLARCGPLASDSI